MDPCFAQAHRGMVRAQAPSPRSTVPGGLSRIQPGQHLATRPRQPSGVRCHSNPAALGSGQPQPACPPWRKQKSPSPRGARGEVQGTPIPSLAPRTGRLKRGAGVPRAHGHGAALDPAPMSPCTSHKQASAPACLLSSRQCCVAGRSGSLRVTDPCPQLLWG